MISRQTNGRHRYRTCMATQICSCPYSIDRSTVCGCRSVCMCVMGRVGGVCVLTHLAWVLLLVNGHVCYDMAWRGVNTQLTTAQKRKHSQQMENREKKLKSAGERKLWKYAWIRNKGNSQIVLYGKLLSGLHRLLSSRVASIWMRA